MEPVTKVYISGIQYEVSPLKMKHLREISKVLSNGTSPKTATFADLDKWLPFIADSIRVKTPDFKSELLDDMTLTEFNTAWAAITEVSGVKFVPKGEMKPTAGTSIMDSSTEGLPSA